MEQYALRVTAVLDEQAWRFLRYYAVLYTITDDNVQKKELQLQFICSMIEVPKERRKSRDVISGILLADSYGDIYHL